MNLISDGEHTRRKLPRPLPSYGVALCAIILYMVTSAHAGEGLYPIQNVPVDEIQKELDFKPDAAWIQHVQHACVQVTPKGIPAGGSGAFVSRNGLIITNRHCVLDVLPDLSKDGHNLVRDGFQAATKADELDCPLEIHALVRAVDVTAQANKDLGNNPTAADVRRLGQQIEMGAKQQGVDAHLVSYFGGAQYWVYVYGTFDAKLVFVPDEALGAFGGEDDNFCFPRHKLDIAFLRAYHQGKPAVSEDFLKLSSTGVHDGDPVFVAGHPGMTERRLPAVQLEYLRDVALPLEFVSAREPVKAITSYMELGDEQRKSGTAALEHWANQMKIYEGSLNFLKTSDYIAQRKIQEQEWRQKIDALPAAKEIAGTAFADLESACKEMAKNAAIQHFSALPNSRLFGLASSLTRFCSYVRNKPPGEIQPQIKSFTGFINHVIDPAVHIDLEMEQLVLAAWLEAAVQQLPADSHFLKVALNGETPAAAAKRLMQNINKLATRESAAALVAHGAADVDAAKLPLLTLLTEMGTPELESSKADYEAAKSRRDSALGKIERALAAVYGAALSPDAAFTLRLGWGKVCGYTENGAPVSWCTTFQSMLARAEGKNSKYPFTISERLKSAMADLDLQTPVDFVSTADGAPGSSGSPVFTKNLDLAGVLFDGNKQDVPSIYAYLKPETGARSICVHSAAICTCLEKVYKDTPLLEELKGVPKPPRLGPLP